MTLMYSLRHRHSHCGFRAGTGIYGGSQLNKAEQALFHPVGVGGEQSGHHASGFSHTAASSCPTSSAPPVTLGPAWLPGWPAPSPGLWGPKSQPHLPPQASGLSLKNGAGGKVFSRRAQETLLLPPTGQ